MNLYLLIGGILSIGLALIHTVWGEKNLAKELLDSDLSELTGFGFYISYHQITSTLTALGLGLVYSGTLASASIAGVLTLFIGLITIGNFAVFLYITVTRAPSLIKLSLPQTVLFVALVLLIAAGYTTI